MRILLLDIETAPTVAHVWKLFKENVGVDQIVESGHVICWAAKWIGERKMHFASLHKSTPKKMLAPVHKMLDEADAVVHFNGTKFDVPMLNAEFMKLGWKPPAPYRQIDLLQTLNRRARFPSHRLAHVAPTLQIGQKVKHEGHELWVKCMNGDPVAWAKMRRYNIQDVILLEGLYKRLLPWIPSHPSHGLYEGRGNCCPSCGSLKLQARGYSRQIANTYKRFQCIECGTWSRGAVTQTTTKERRELVRQEVVR